MPSQTDMIVQKLEGKFKNRPNSLIFSRLADSYRKGGDVQRAISICVKGLESHPDYVTGRIILGRCYLEQENFNDAIKEFSKICQLDRRNQIAIKMLADIFSKQGMEEKAGDLYQVLFTMDPENPSLEHLTTVFKGSNKRDLFEILGIEDIGVKATPSVKSEAEEELPEVQDAQAILEEVGISEAEDQAVTSPEAVPEVPEALEGEEQATVAPEIPTEDVAIPETAEQAAAAPEGIPEESVPPETVEQAEVAPEAISEETALPETVEQAAVVPEQTLEDALAPETAQQIPPTKEIAPEDIVIPETAKETEAAPDLVSETESPTAAIEEEPSIDEILSPETGIVEAESVMEDIQEEPETPTEEGKEIVTETDVIPKADQEDVEILEGLEQDKVLLDDAEKQEVPEESELKIEEEQPAIPEQADKGLEDVKEEKPEIDDMSMRMDSMFSEESEELVSDISGAAAIETQRVEAERDMISTAIDSKDSMGLSEVVKETEDSKVSELSTRLEDMFAEGEEISAPVAAEAEKPEPEEEVLPAVDIGTAATEIIDKKTLEEVSKPETEVVEKIEEETLDIAPPEPEVLGISEDVITPGEEISEEKELLQAATEIIDRETGKREIPEEAQDLGDITQAAPFPEPSEELVSDLKGVEDTSESAITDATAEFDRDMIKKVALSEADELGETVDATISEIPDDGTSVSGEEVISRLDEMFPSEDEPEPVHEMTTDTVDISLEEPATQEVDHLQKDSVDELVETVAQTEEDFGVTREISEPYPDSESAERGRLDDIAISSETKSYTQDFGKGWESKETESFELDTVESGEPLSGADVASRIDEMFFDEDSLDDTSVTSIPDEDIGDHEPVGEFYTESGETASEEEEVTVSEEGVKVQDDEMTIESLPDIDIGEGEPISELQPEFGEAVSSRDAEVVLDESEEAQVEDTVTAELPPDEELTVVDEKAAIDEISITSIPDEGIEESEPISEFYTESGETASLEDEVFEEDTEEKTNETAVSDLIPDEELAIVDDKAAVDEMSIASIPEEGIEESEPISEFYTESGETAIAESDVADEESIEKPASEELVKDLAEGDFAGTIDTAFEEDQITGDSSEEDILDEVPVDSAADEEFYTISGEEPRITVPDDSIVSTSEEVPVSDSEEASLYESGALTDQESEEEQVQQMEEALEVKADSIPDHVLTPTLADIYYQQDQPHLAIQIYKRLLGRDPDNEKIAHRIVEIEQVIKEKEAQLEKTTSVEKVTGGKRGRKRKTVSRKKKLQKDPRPLKGIKIKKKIKQQIKQAKRKLEI